MKRFNAFLLLAVFSFFSPIVWTLVPKVAEGAVPKSINIQGVLRQPNEQPVTDGSYSITFKIYNASTGGDVLWTETRTVSTSAGLFTVLIGTTNPVPDSALSDSLRWLGITVSPDPEMLPRQRLGSVPYALQVELSGAGTSSTVGGGSNNQASGDSSTVSRWQP